MCPMAVPWVTALQLPVCLNSAAHRSYCLRTSLQTHSWPSPLDDEHAKSASAHGCLNLLPSSPKVRARDIAHCRPIDASSLSPGALTAEQAPCWSHGAMPHPCGVLTHYPFTQFSVSCCYTPMPHIKQRQVTRAPGQIAFSSSPASACPCLQQPECCSEWARYCNTWPGHNAWQSLFPSISPLCDQTQWKPLKNSVWTGTVSRHFSVWQSRSHTSGLHYQQQSQKNQELQAKTLQPWVNSVLQVLFNQQLVILLQCVRSY